MNPTLNTQKWKCFKRFQKHLQQKTALKYEEYWPSKLEMRIGSKYHHQSIL